MRHAVHEPASIGRNIERIRRLKGIKQETLANELGISRQLLSKIEQSDTLDDERLEQVAGALGVTAEVIRKFNDEAVVIHVENMNDNSGFNFNCTFNPIEKIVELYDALLKSEKEKNELLERMLRSREDQPKKK
ncbi:MAG TPA: helix-turn-helix transcriptional regulator [Edaphocola sp.]|nr:helix-turn-helix transcriptional regulator [Edaphocola sp.]